MITLTAIGTRKITQFTFMRFGIQMNTIGMFPETGLSPKFFGTKLAFVFSLQILVDHIIMHSQFGGNFEYSGTSRSGAWVSLAAICTWMYCHFMLPKIIEKLSTIFFKNRVSLRKKLTKNATENNDEQTIDVVQVISFLPLYIYA